LLFDLTNPSPGIGWANKEREGLIKQGPADAVLTLVLIYYLTISNYVPLDRLAGFSRQLCQWLIIEFIPKSDSQIQRLLSTRKDIFAYYNLDYFEYVFEKYFTIRRKQAIQDSDRSLYLMKGHE